MNANLILEITLLILVFAALALNYFSKQPSTPEISYDYLRASAFIPQTAPAQTISSKEAVVPFAAMMEIRYPGTVVTLVAHRSGEASLYLSNGSTITGDLSRELLRESAIHFVQQSRKYVYLLHHVENYPLPQIGQVRFYLMTPSGVYSAEVPEKLLKRDASSLTDLYRYGHYVIYQLGKLKKERDLFQ